MRARCPNCERGFNCDGDDACWCLKVDRKFDYEAMILRSGAAGCVCPVDVEATASTSQGTGPGGKRRGGRLRRENRPRMPG
jgi:hypothetical protein